MWAVTVGDFRAGPREREYVNQVLDSGRLSYGPFCRKFEEEFARAHGCKHAVFCNSGTSALHLAVAALKERHGWADGDEVIVPSVTFVATANVVLHNNLRPVFVDVDPLTYNIDAGRIEERITARTRAIIPVHLAGRPADMTAVCRLAECHGLRVIEDSCETAFVGHAGKKVGAWGDVGCFSTYMAHYIVTGVGGLATTNDPDLAVLLRSLANHGRDSIYISIDDDDGLSGDRLREVVARRFRFRHVGHSFRVTELEAALGLAQLERKDEILARRQRVASRYTGGLADLARHVRLPWVPAGVEHAFMIYPVVTAGFDKTELVNFLESKGVETRDLLPLLGQPVYRKLFGDILPDYPVAHFLDRCGFYIGCHQYVTDEMVDHVVAAFHEFFGVTPAGGAK